MLAVIMEDDHCQLRRTTYLYLVRTPCSGHNYVHSEKVTLYFRMYRITLLLGLLIQKLSATESSISNENDGMRYI